MSMFNWVTLILLIGLSQTQKRHSMFNWVTLIGLSQTQILKVDNFHQNTCSKFFSSVDYVWLTALVKVRLNEPSANASHQGRPHGGGGGTPHAKKRKYFYPNYPLASPWPKSIAPVMVLCIFYLTILKPLMKPFAPYYVFVGLSYTIIHYNPSPPPHDLNRWPWIPPVQYQ